MPEDNMLEPVPFRFLDLPKELRFMIYENLSISTKQLRLLPLQHELRIEPQTTPPRPDQPAITITLHTLPVQIFTTSRIIYSEALPFLTRKLDRIRAHIPMISIDSDCLYTYALHRTQALFQSLLSELNQQLLLTPHLPSTSTQTETHHPGPQYPRQIQHWLTQTTHILLSQHAPQCPFAGLMGTRTYPTVRLIVQVSKMWKYTSYRNLVASSAHGGTPPLYTASVATQMTELWSELAGYTKGLERVKGGAVVFGQEDERVVLAGGLLVRKTVALDFGVCRAC